MAEFVKGDIVVVPFPFSDLTHAKRRPAFVVVPLEGNDAILCQITSQTVKDKYSVAINDGDFERGGLRLPSHVRPNRLFTADKNIILYAAGHLKQRKVAQITQIIISIIRD